jgi:ribosomal protein S18 acetylase RimI-like enzyme
MNLAEKIKIIEQNHQKHFEFLPSKLGYNLQKIKGVSIISCGLGSSMFNIAYGNHLTRLNFTNEISNIKKAFNNQPFAWWIPPSTYNLEFSQELLGAGFKMETVEHAMICNLAETKLPKQKTDITIKPVARADLLQDFIEVIEPYDHTARSFYEMLKIEHIQSSEKLFVGYEADMPVAIAILFISEFSAGIFSLLTKNSARGKGYGTDMMRFLLETAKENNCNYVTLSASSDSGYRIYESFNFLKIGEFECFEYSI